MLMARTTVPSAREVASIESVISMAISVDAASRTTAPGGKGGTAGGRAGGAGGAGGDEGGGGEGAGGDGGGGQFGGGGG